MKPQNNRQYNNGREPVDMDSAYKALEVAIAEFKEAEQRLLAARALCFELYQKSDPYKVLRQWHWDNCRDDKR
ncbi:hypothetical protein CAP35_12470 [Chitinophagaceae bacterium IBVUCB1]|nr:hypothetical protein CAP35_12470 [Chitinophagaceae bacterium IBVUCB1]